MTARRPLRNVLRFESLESRTLMAYDVFLSGHVLKITGSDKSDDVSIVANAATNKVTVQIHDHASGQLKKSDTRDLSKIEKLDVDLKKGNDSVQNETNLPMKAQGRLGNDTLIGGSAADQLFGGDGDDNLSGNSGDDLLDGGAGADVILPGAGNDVMRGGAGEDFYEFDETSGGADVIEETTAKQENWIEFYGLKQGITWDMNSTTAQPLGAGQSLRVSNPAAIDVVMGTNYSDSIIGSPRNDSMMGLGGDDTLNGNGGDDRLDGGFGDDSLAGGAGNDTLDGSYGNDVLEGGSENDLMNGGYGSDRYVFGPGQLGADRIHEAGSDIDTLDFRNFSRGLILGMDKQTLVNNPNLQLTADQPELLENAIGSQFDDTITGNSADNMIWGQGGDDTLTGLGGYDVLLGDAGNDHLNSDAVDLLFGGIGTDSFDGLRETGPFGLLRPNPNTGHYRDWGRVN